MKKVIPILFLWLSACATIPNGIEPVHDFNVNRYVGKWFEIARLDNPFERGLNHISAEYSLEDDGGLVVINSGINSKSNRREYAEGKAYFTDKPDVGSLKVSFFGPFYSAYHIIELDKLNYDYVMITGSGFEYLWILARTPKIDEAVLRRLIKKARLLGYKTERLIFPVQSSVD